MMHVLVNRIGLFRLLAALLAYVPGMLQAHVKWFVPLSDTASVSAGFSLADPAVRLWLLIAVLMVGASVWLDRNVKSPAQPQGRWRTIFNRSLPMLTGLSLLLGTEAGNILAPHYRWEGNYATALLALQAATGLLLLLPATTFVGAFALLLLYAGVTLQYGPLELLEYFNLVGTAAFLYCVFHPSLEWRRRLAPFALPLLRICTGIALVSLGFAEKLRRPDYAEEFLHTYMWNFMYNLGVEDYSDRLFILSAGTMEVVFGIILILGTTTRLNILAISGFMLTSNLTFVVEGHTREAITEIIGHLPIMATAIICVAFGSGERLRFYSLFPRRVTAYSSA